MLEHPFDWYYDHLQTILHQSRTDCMQNKKYILVFLLLFALGACTSSSQGTKHPLITAPIYPPCSFAVLTDPHLYCLKLGSTGKAFTQMLESDSKMVHYSEELVDAFIAESLQQDIQFIIIPGDLTKDGEKASHLLLAQKLHRLVEAGKKVYVIPGNHDVANGNAFAYKGDYYYRTENTDKIEFSAIYSDMGYTQALFRDEDSLSYIAEPVPGLWLFCLDSCRYRENPKQGHSVTGGKFYPATIHWIQKMLTEAALRKKAVITFSHHNLIPHFSVQPKYFVNYIIQDYQTISDLFLRFGVRLHFSGHFHSQDIAAVPFSEDEGFLYDIETGSLNTYPHPWRIVRIESGNVAKIQSFFIRSIPSYPSNFPEYSHHFALEGMTAIGTRILKMIGFSGEEARKSSPRMIPLLMQNFYGDESFSFSEIDTSGLRPWSRTLINLTQELVDSMGDDPAPADNCITINLNNGMWKKQ